MRFAYSKAKFPALVGGLGSGKTQAGIIRLLLKMMHKKGIDGAYYMPSYDLIKLRAMAGTVEILERYNLPYEVNNTSYQILLPWLGSRIVYRSYERPERIVAYEVAHSVVDEIDTIPKEKAEIVWRKVVERNRQNIGTPNTIGIVTTPDQGFHGFVYQKWGQSVDADWPIIKASTWSNPYLPDDYVDQIRANYDPVLADLYINGDFVSLTQNKVYHFFDREKHTTERTLQTQDVVIEIGLDFNIGGCCATVFISDGDKCYAIDEFVSYDTRDFIMRLKSQYAKHRVIVYPDASGASQRTNASQSDIDLISQAGFYVDAPKSNPAIRDRINFVNGMLSHNRLFINVNKCKKLTEAIESQGYDDKGMPEKFDSHPAIDDWVDSMGYFIARKFPIIRNSTSISVGGGL